LRTRVGCERGRGNRMTARAMHPPPRSLSFGCNLSSACVPRTWRACSHCSAAGSRTRKAEETRGSAARARLLRAAQKRAVASSPRAFALLHCRLRDRGRSRMHSSSIISRPSPVAGLHRRAPAGVLPCCCTPLPLAHAARSGRVRHPSCAARQTAGC
jgi:hypothetical protein